MESRSEDGRPGAPSRPADCACLARGPRARATSSQLLGVDPTGGRFADVEAAECAACGRMWLVYRWEIEAITKSGRWYAGVVPPEVIERVGPEEAPEVLEGLAWHLCGGSYFGGKVYRRSGPLLG